MRLLVFLLILVNLMFFAWTQGLLGRPDNPDALRMSQQLAADQITVISRDEAPGAAAAAKNGKREAETCLLLNDLALTEAARIGDSIVEKNVGLKVERSETAPGGIYWVYIPPAPSKADAERKASELKRLKVPEMFVMTEAGPQRFAISLGTFSTREAAESRLEELRGKGVRSAKVGERDIKAASASLEIRGGEALLEALRQTLPELAPKAKPLPCKAARPAAA